MTETWKDIPGYEGLYQAGSLGNIKALMKHTVGADGRNMTFQEKQLQPSLSTNGYLIVALTKNKKQKSFTVHRLIAKCFCKNYSESLDVNHLDGNKLNNAADNLECTTRSENLKHAFRLGLKNHKLGNSPMARKIKDRNTGIVYPTIIEAAKVAGINKNTLCAYLTGRKKNNSTMQYAD